MDTFIYINLQTEKYHRGNDGCYTILLTGLFGTFDCVDTIVCEDLEYDEEIRRCIFIREIDHESWFPMVRMMPHNFNGFEEIVVRINKKDQKRAKYLCVNAKRRVHGY